MEKLERLRKVQLVRVKGELEAAKTLVVRQADHDEAADRLEQLQELAGDFQRTQERIEGSRDNLDEIAAEHSKWVEFDTAYRKAKELLEKHIDVTKPVRAVSRKGSIGSLQEEMQLLRAVAAKCQTANGGESGPVLGRRSDPDDNTQREVSNRAHIAEATTTIKRNTSRTTFRQCGDASDSVCKDPDGMGTRSFRHLSGSTVEKSAREKDNVETAEKQLSSSSLALNEPFMPNRAISERIVGDPMASQQIGVTTPTGKKEQCAKCYKKHPKVLCENRIVPRSGTGGKVSDSHISMMMAQDPRGAQRKAHILPTAAVSVRGIDVALSQASLDSKTCGGLNLALSNEDILHTGQQLQATHVIDQDSSGEFFAAVRKEEEECDSKLVMFVKKIQEERGFKQRVGEQRWSANVHRWNWNSRPPARTRQAQINVALIESTNTLKDLGSETFQRYFKDATFSYKELWIRGLMRPGSREQKTQTEFNCWYCSVGAMHHRFRGISCVPWKQIPT